MTSNEGDVASTGDSDGAISEGQPRESYWSDRLGQTPRPSASGKAPWPGEAAIAPTRAAPPPAVPREAAPLPRQPSITTKTSRKRLAIFLAAVALIVGSAAAALAISMSSHSPTSTSGSTSGSTAAATPLTWTKPMVLDPAMTNGSQSDYIAISGATDVSCPSTTFCLAFVGNDALTYDGHKWSAPRTLATSVSGKSISCATVASCVVSSGGFDSGTYYLFANGGWSGPTPVLIDGEQISSAEFASVRSLTCPTTSFCAGSTTAHGIVTYNGQGWAITSSPAPSLEYLFDHVSCASATWCFAVGGSAVTAFDGHTWTAPQSIDPGMRAETGLSAVSCPTPQFCAAVDEAGNAFTYNGHSWSKADSIDPGHGQFGPTTISCPTSTFCVAVELLGDAFEFDGTGWTSLGTILPQVTLNSINDNVADVSCASTQLCVVISTKGRAVIGS